MAQEAGEFGLHLWTDSDTSGKRRFLPGSPFAVRVTGVRAAAAGSFIMGVEEYTDGPADEEMLASAGADVVASLTAGERLQLHPHTRDEFGNASFATDSALTCTLQTPGEHGEHSMDDVAIKRLKELGSYEIVSELTKKGVHSMSIHLNGEHIGGSPVQVPLT